jgi:hypothetical protein
MTKRLVSGTLVAVLLVSTVVSADGGATNPPSGPGLRPAWTFVGIGAGFGVGLWAGLTAFDDSTDSDRKVWTSAMVGAAAGGLIGYLVDRHRAKSRPAPTSASSLVISPHDERDVIVAARRLGDGQLKRWLDAGAPVSPVFHGERTRGVNWQLTTEN